MLVTADANNRDDAFFDDCDGGVIEIVLPEVQKGGL